MALNPFWDLSYQSEILRSPRGNLGSQSLLGFIEPGEKIEDFYEIISQSLLGFITLFSFIDLTAKYILSIPFGIYPNFLQTESERFLYFSQSLLGFILYQFF